MKRFWNVLNNLKLQNKLTLIFIVSGFIPVLILFVVSYTLMRGVLMDKERESLEGYLSQAVSALEYQIRIYHTLSDYIAFNQALTRVIGQDYASDYERYEEIVNQLDPILMSVKYLHPEVRQITIYMEGNAIRHDTSLDSVDVISSTSWYAEVEKSSGLVWFIDSAKKEVFCARKMPLLNKAGQEGILYIEMDYDELFSCFPQETIFNYGMYVANERGRVVFSREEDSGQFHLTYLDVRDAAAENSRAYTILSQEVGDLGWMVYLYKSRSFTMDPMYPIAVIIVVFLILCIVSTGVALLSASSLIVRRLAGLLENMNQVERGNFSLTVQDESRDEIGNLIHGFDRMLTQIRRLIKEVLESKIVQKEYEMKALQAQINPHFLYNSLSIINWKAIEAGEKEISQVTLALSTFYRTSLNKGNNVISVEDEISNVKSYLLIQSVMHDYSFDIVYDIDSAILPLKVLNLILQPVAENAIEHGIDQLTDKRGRLILRGYTEEGMLYLTVEDNGAGMPPEMSQSILTSQSGGYGIRNVHERIQLYFGKMYGIDVESAVGEGTKITLKFPITYTAPDKKGREFRWEETV